MAERKKREWKDFNPNRGTSETNNPLIQKDEWLKSKIKKREGAFSSASGNDKAKAAAGGDKSGAKAMKTEGTSRNFAGSGKGEGYPNRTKVDGSKFTNKPSSSVDNYREAQKEQVKAKAPEPRDSKPRRRPGAGREDMMSRYMDERKRKQSGQSRVIGS